MSSPIEDTLITAQCMCTQCQQERAQEMLAAKEADECSPPASDNVIHGYPKYGVAIAGQEHIELRHGLLWQRMQVNRTDLLGNRAHLIQGYPIYENGCGFTLMLVTNIAAQHLRNDGGNPVGTDETPGGDGKTYDQRRDWHADLTDYTSEEIGGMPAGSCMWVPTKAVNDGLIVPISEHNPASNICAADGSWWLWWGNSLACQEIPYQWQTRGKPLSYPETLENDDQRIKMLKYPDWFKQNMPGYDKVKPLPAVPELAPLPVAPEVALFDDMLLEQLAAPVPKMLPLKAFRPGQLNMAFAKPYGGKARLRLVDDMAAAAAFMAKAPQPQNLPVQCANLTPPEDVPQRRTELEVREFNLDYDQKQDVWAAWHDMYAAPDDADEAKEQLRVLAQARVFLDTL